MDISVFFLWLLSSAIVYRYSVFGETDPKCYDNCTCCKQGNCHTGVHNWTNVCRYGCIDGHRGARCYELCPFENCKSCGFHNNDNTCTACYDGYHLGPYKNCSLPCPSNCQSCTSSTFCITCKEGFYKDSSATCKYSTCPNNCECTMNQNCISCKAGYFDKTSLCKKKCPINCLTCDSYESCGPCKTGFYNGYLHDNLTGLFFRNCTFQCRDTCPKCRSYNHCSECVKGKFGKTCQESCSLGCISGNCAIESGNCACSFNFFGDKCKDCIDGKYGMACNLNCPTYCKGKQCNKTSGNCVDGCVSDGIVGSTCDKCKSSLYGEFCNNSCPKNCKDKICERYNGSCSYGCVNNFNGTHCDLCKNGLHGQNCDLSCPDDCSYAMCEKTSGDCRSCSGNFEGPKCDLCTSGFYGQECMDICSKQCFNRTCDRSSGVCIYGCEEGFSGDLCCAEGKTCKNCSSDTECEVCETGFHASNCTEKCPANCAGFCDFSLGVCDGCLTDFFGKFCNMTCSENCSHSQDKNRSQCEQSNGRCIHGCVDGQFGSTCNETCSRLCVNKTCRQDTGKCKYGCVGGEVVSECFQSQAQTDKGDSLIGPVVGGVATLVIIAAGILASLLYRRRLKTKDTSDQILVRKQKKTIQEGHVYANIRNKNKKQKRNTFGLEVSMENIVMDAQNNETSDDIQDYYNCTADSFSVKVADLFSYVTLRQTQLLEKDFKNLPKPGDLSKLCKFAKKDENIAFNRYNGIYPYDHSRVTIPGQPRFFINACYIDGYKRKKAYIASFGPTAKTTYQFSTFWRMLWHEKSDIIVMLTNLHEESGMKCEQYWPDADKEEQYDQVKVKCRSVEVFAEYTVRTFSVSKDKQQRNLTQLHYTAWPDKGVPSEVTSLVEFRQRVKAVPVALDGPVIVHCSAGIGRTGTYIALDILTEQGKTEEAVDVFHCVSKMRDQRLHMVQTEEQYLFLHKTLVHSLTFDCEAVTAEQIQKQAFETDERFRQMFQTLQMVVDTETDKNVEAREENRRKYSNKSRPHSDIPGERGRVRLFLNRKSGAYDYINAVFISSFKTKNLFIGAQTPLPSTVEDFLGMIYQQCASCVVALESPQAVAKKSDVGTYLPADNEIYRCGDFTVTCSRFETKPQYVLKKLFIQNVENGEGKTVYHFQYMKWRNGHKVAENPADFVHFIKEVGKYCGKQEKPHVVVHCLNGYERSGLFCVVYTLLEKLEAERQVSVVNIVRKVRTQRKLAISSVEQLKFCYQCVSAYLESYNTYYNYAM